MYLGAQNRHVLDSSLRKPFSTVFIKRRARPLARRRIASSPVPARYIYLNQSQWGAPFGAPGLGKKFWSNVTFKNIKRKPLKFIAGISTGGLAFSKKPLKALARTAGAAALIAGGLFAGKALMGAKAASAGAGAVATGSVAPTLIEQALPLAQAVLPIAGQFLTPQSAPQSSVFDPQSAQQFQQQSYGQPAQAPASDSAAKNWIIPLAIGGAVLALIAFKS